MARKTPQTDDLREQIKAAAEADLQTFINLVHPHRMLGMCHEDVIDWWQDETTSTHNLLLFPRDHMKSALAAYRAAQRITKDPSVRILYISATANLAQKQLKFIKDILTSDVYRYYWPEMVNIEEAKREKWTETEISVDHPRRKAETVRDPTVFTAGLTTTITGLHFDVLIMDDVVVPDNAYTEEGRSKVAAQASQLASIAGTDSEVWVVGTRYHPKDLYADLINMKVDDYDEDTSERLEEYNLYHVYQKEVEDRGDGTGVFLWPRQQRVDGKWFGFNAKILARKKAQYLDKTQFFAQYYNNPNDPAGAGINRDFFQYFDRTKLGRTSGYWTYQGRRLNLTAAVDFAYSVKAKSDYTAIVVVGVDADFNYYVLDIDRFKSALPSEYFKHILALHQKWDFRKLRAEVTAAQQAIVNDLKVSYIRRHGLALSIEDHKPTRNDGSKAERISAILQPRYENRQMWHYRDGNCQLLEDELVLEKPPHDDIKDCLASAVEIALAPTGSRMATTIPASQGLTHNRFGGIA